MDAKAESTRSARSRRRPAWIGCGLAFAGLLVVVFLGPRVKVDDKLVTVDLPADLDSYLQRQEERFPDIRPGTEKQIVWADPVHREPTDIAVVYLHGFSATRQEVHPLAELLAARLGANLFLTRLTGHGRTGQALAAASPDDWLRDASEALGIGRRLGRKVLLVGTSTGATLAAWLAARTPNDDLLAVVLISPNFYPHDSRARLLLWPWGERIGRLIAGPEIAWTPMNEDVGRYWTTRYPIRALVSMMGIVGLIERTSLAGIESPVLVFYSPRDTVADPERTQLRFAEIGSGVKRLVRIDEVGDPANHVLAGDILSPESTGPILSEMLDFLQPLSGKEP